ncbi:hypothetical protein QQ045_023955 [Rhodiola kirilowii]
MATYSSAYYYSSFQPAEVSYFTGEGVDQWLYQIEGFFSKYMTAPEQKFVVAVPYLSGEAMEWYRQMWLARQLSTWENFVIDLKSRFKPPETQQSRAELLDSIRNMCEELKQTLGEMKTQNSVYMSNLSKLKSHVSSISTSDFSIDKLEESDAAQIESITTELYAPEESDLVSKNTAKEVIVVEDIIEDTESVDLILDSSRTWRVSKSFGMDTTSIYSDINHDTASDESLVAGVPVRKVTSNIFLADFSSGLVLNHAEIREWRFETQFYALKGTLRSLLPTVCENVKMSLLSLLVGVTNLIKSWCSVFMKPPSQPPDTSLNILHGLDSFVNFKLMGVQYKHDILYDLHGWRITMTVSIQGVKFGKISAPYVYEGKPVFIIVNCNLLIRDTVPFSWTPKLSYELGLEQTLNFLHKVVKHVMVGESKLRFVKACNAFVEWENDCGYLAAAMSASKVSIPKHFDVIGTNWVSVSIAFGGEIVDLDLFDQASSDLAETNSDMGLNDLLQSVKPHVCLMYHTQFDSFTILNMESFNKAFSDEYSAAPSILEVIIVFDSHPEIRQERLSHEVFQWGICGRERLSDANADTISLQWEDREKVLYGGQENMVQKFHPAVKALTDNTDIRLNHPVTKIYHGINKVMVTIEEGMGFVANVVIFIVSLGVREANLKTKLSEWKIVLIHDLGVDNEEQVPSEFDDVFHPNVEFMAVVPPIIYAKCLPNFCKVTSQPNLVYMTGGGLAYDHEKFSGDAALKSLALNF